jgi:hypothetical protein
MCDLAMQIKKQWVFPLHISNGNRYIPLQNVLCDQPNRQSLVSCVHNVEQDITSSFIPVYSDWCSGKLSTNDFFKQYKSLTASWFNKYKESFAIKD